MALILLYGGIRMTVRPVELDMVREGTASSGVSCAEAGRPRPPGILETIREYMTSARE